MPTMKNIKTGENKEMTAEALMEAVRDGKLTIQQQVHHADGTVTSSTIYGNEVGDGIDRSMNVFGTMSDILKPAMQMAKRNKDADEGAENIFYMDDSDVDYEVTFDDTSTPIMYIISCTNEGVTVSMHTRDERKTVGKPISEAKILFKNREITATLEEVQEKHLLLFAFAIHELRRILRERGVLQELQRIGNMSSGVMITSSSEDGIDARIVRGTARPDLPCMMFGGLFSEGIEDAVMMRPYVDELMTDALYENMSLAEKIQAAEDGNTDLMEELAMYYMGECDEPDEEKAVYWIQKMADAGIPAAMFSLGLHYAMDFGADCNLEEAINWMEKAAANGDADIQYEVAKWYTYIKEDGEMIDADRSKYWYSQAAEKGHEMAQVIVEGPMFNEDSEEAEQFKAFEDIYKYEHELYNEGIWPDAPSPEEDPETFWRVRFMAEEGDEKAIAVLEAFEDFFACDDSDVDDDEDSKTNEELKEQAKEFMATVIANDNGVIVNLLTNTNRDCLITPTVGATDFEQLCKDGYILFDNQGLNLETAKDCFIGFSLKNTTNIFGKRETQYVFDIICNMCVNDLNDYKTRSLELCSNLSNMLNGYEFGDGEKLIYRTFSSQPLSDQHIITSVCFTNNGDYSSNQGTSAFVDYDKDSRAIFEHLFEDEDIKNSIMRTSQSAQEAYEDGHMMLSENLTGNVDKGYDGWIILAWDFSIYPSINIVPVVKSKKQLKPLVSAIKKKLNNFELPTRGTLNYAADYSQEKIELSDELFVAMLIFMQ